MLRMTPLASAIVALLIGIEAYAAEETFDTHFMIGGMKDQQVSNIRLEDNQPLPGQYDIDIYVNGVGNMRSLLKTTRKKHVYQGK